MLAMTNGGHHDKSALGSGHRGLLGLGGATLTPWLAARRDRMRSRALVRAYLVSILDIALSRGHADRANAVLAAWKAVF
jgi:hypothetical protein